jgi:DNA-binding response OmpR family regulator
VKLLLDANLSPRGIAGPLREAGHDVVALAEEPTRVYGKQELLRDVWGYLSMGNTRTLDAHACRLRKKLTPSGRPWVVNVRAVGYKLTEAL